MFLSVEKNVSFHRKKAAVQRKCKSSGCGREKNEEETDDPLHGLSEMNSVTFCVGQSIARKE